MRRSVGMLLCLVALGGCADEVEEVRPATAEEVERHLPELAVPLLEQAGESLAVVRDQPDLAVAELAMQVLRGRSDLADALGDAGELGATLGRMVPEPGDGPRLVQHLIVEIFDPANYEGDGVWRVPGAAVCGGACAAVVDTLGLRLRVRLRFPLALELALLFGEERALAGTLTLRIGSIALAVELPVARDIAAAAEAAAGRDWPVPEALGGRVTAEIRRDGLRYVTLEVGLPEGVHVELGALAVDVDRSDPVFTLTVWPAEGAAVVDLAVARVQVWYPPVYVDVPAVTAGVELRRGSGRILATGLGLGDRTTEAWLGAERLVAIDLNADAGRALDLTIARQDQGLPLFSLAPRLELAAALHLAPLLPLVPGLPSFVLDETYRVETASDPAVQPALRQGHLALRVRAGSVRLSSSAAADPVEAAAGTALLLGDELTPGEHPLLGRLAVIPDP